MPCCTKTLVAAVALLAMQIPGHAQTSDDLFDDGTAHEIRLYVHPSDWARLRANYLENTFYPADLSWRGLEAANIGVRSRGFGSRNGIKPGLEIEFDRYVRGQTFLGLTSLVLDNSIQDASFLRARLSMLLFREMRIPAPRETYARLYVNSQYVGLYVMAEPIDENFLTRSFRENAGYLYEYRWRDYYYFDYLGSNTDLYSPRLFEPRTRENDFDPAAIVELVHTINFADTSQLAEFLDLELFLRFIAVENFLAEGDGILGIWGMDNFYLYRFQNTRRFQLIPWDRNFSFLDAYRSVRANADTNVLTHRLFQIPEFDSAYTEALRRTALVAGAAGDWLDQELERAYAQMRSAALEDPLKPGTNAQFEDDVEAIRDFVRKRRDYVISQLGPLPPPAVSSGGIVNTASLAQQPLAPGSIASIFGTNLAVRERAASAIPLPTATDQTIVRMNGIATPLFFISPLQINFQVPWELEGQRQAHLTVEVEGVLSAPEAVELAAISPGLFTINPSGQGAVLVAATGEVAAASGSVAGRAARPVRRGEFISIYCTGLGPVTSRPLSGERPSGNSLSRTTVEPSVTVGGAPAWVTFSGLAPGTIGLYQVNAQVPEDASVGDAVPVVLTIGGIGSNTVTIAVQ